VHRGQVRTTLLAEMRRGQQLAALRAALGHCRHRWADMGFFLRWADVGRRDVHPAVLAVGEGQQRSALAASWHVQRRADVDGIGPVYVSSRRGAAPV
jgi:hypothetical protein